MLFRSARLTPQKFSMSNTTPNTAQKMAPSAASSAASSSGTVTQQYDSKRLSASDAVKCVQNGDYVVVPSGVGEPPTLLTALSDQRLAFNDIKVSQILGMRKYAYLDPATADNIRNVAYFCVGWSLHRFQSAS